MIFNKHIQILGGIKNYLKQTCGLDPTERFTDYILVQYKGEVIRITVTKDKETINDKLLINALTEAGRRCPICFRHQIGQNCDGCKNYYAECTCIHLTLEQIINGYDE